MITFSNFTFRTAHSDLVVSSKVTILNLTYYINTPLTVLPVKIVSNTVSQSLIRCTRTFFYLIVTYITRVFSLLKVQVVNKQFSTGSSRRIFGSRKGSVWESLKCKIFFSKIDNDCVPGYAF